MTATSHDQRRTPRHVATVHWINHGPDFMAGQYSREHTWSFDGGIVVAASPSPHVVPAPWSVPAAIDPEEAFLAAISSCHMLTFLWLAARSGWTVAEYRDDCQAILTKNDRRVPWVSEATLRPRIWWSGARQPTRDEVAALHARAHEECFIANSVKTVIRVEDADAA